MRPNALGSKKIDYPGFSALGVGDAYILGLLRLAIIGSRRWSKPRSATPASRRVGWWMLTAS